MLERTLTLLMALPLIEHIVIICLLIRRCESKNHKSQFSFELNISLFEFGLTK